ncbi:FecR family protein [Pedobacter sp. UBA4863]|uniref:FecR family protein n=1 Tax=Pedobacter sp. UBA4863 TaxID=1947060 RepID=UPI0025FCE4B6|nr:FecR domain-containing protein [Pedobacter sp. UBA4863]
MNDELLIKFLLNETTAEETAQVQKWIGASAENQKYYYQFERIWNESATLAESSEADEELAWQKFKQRLNERQLVQPVVKKIKTKPLWWQAAAVFVICFGAWAAYQQFVGGYTNLASTHLVVNKELPDGSQLVLNKNTNISYAADFKTNRKVKIKSGEVFFDVAHNRSHPFVIDIDEVKVEVVGTSFNIKKNKESVEVIVESGTVKITAQGQPTGSKELRLTKGESVLLEEGKGIAVKKQTEDELYNYYRTALFVANNTSLARLVAILSEAYGEKISLSESVRNDKISTTLPFKYSLEKNLETICETLDLKKQRNQDGILLSKK